MKKYRQPELNQFVLFLEDTVLSSSITVTDENNIFDDIYVDERL